MNGQWYVDISGNIPLCRNRENIVGKFNKIYFIALSEKSHFWRNPPYDVETTVC